MNPFERIARLVDIHQLITQRKTGSPIEFARKFYMSRSQLYNIIGELEDYGAIIQYSRKQKTFYYGNNFKLFETVFWKKVVDFFKKNPSVQGSWTEEK